MTRQEMMDFLHPPILRVCRIRDYELINIPYAT